MKIDRWKQFAFGEKIGHIGSELSRAMNLENKDEQLYKKSLIRAIELINLTIETENNPDQVREVLQLKEMVNDFLANKIKPEIHLQNLVDWCINIYINSKSLC